MIGISRYHRLELGDHASGCHSSPGLALFALLHGFSSFVVFGCAGAGLAFGAVSGDVADPGAFCAGAALTG